MEVSDNKQKEVIGRIDYYFGRHGAPVDSSTFYDKESYLKAIKEGLYNNPTGFKHHTITEDASVHKAVSEITKSEYGDIIDYDKELRKESPSLTPKDIISINKQIEKRVSLKLVDGDNTDLIYDVRVDNKSTGIRYCKDSRLEHSTGVVILFNRPSGTTNNYRSFAYKNAEMKECYKHYDEIRNNYYYDGLASDPKGILKIEALYMQQHPEAYAKLNNEEKSYVDVTLSLLKPRLNLVKRVKSDILKKAESTLGKDWKNSISISSNKKNFSQEKSKGRKI